MSVVVEKELPKGWIRTNIDSISKKIHYGFTQSSKKYDTGTKYLRITDIQNNNVDWNSVPFCDITNEERKNFLLKQNDLLFARTGGTVGKSYLIQEDIPVAVFASYLIRISISNYISPKFINLFFQTNDYWKQIQIKKTGLKTNVNAQILSKLVFNLPPLNEQKKIVSKIEELFSLVDSAKDTLEKTKILLKQYRQSILKHAFEGKLVPQDPNDEPASVLLEKIKKENPDKKFSDIVSEKELPKGWRMVLLSEISVTKSGGTPSRKNSENYLGNIPWIKSGELNDSYINKSEETISQQALDNSNATIFPRDTILIAMYGATIGKLGILGIDASTNQAICGIRFNKEIVLQKFLFNFLLFQKRNLINLGFGGAQKNISQEIIRAINIPIPPLNEQKRIVAKIEESFSLIEKNEILIDQLLLQYKQIKNSILKQAFEGKLVPQDPNDEPAEVLLQRIKEEKNHGK